MKKREYLISSVQLFWIIFAFVFSGFFLGEPHSFISVVVSCIFASVMSIAAGEICRGFASSYELYFSAFGGAGVFFRYISLAFISFFSAGSLLDFSSGVSAYYKGEVSAVIFAVCLILCVFAVSKDFTGAARFAELCAFAVLVILLLLFGGKGGSGFEFVLFTQDMPVLFDSVGCSAAIFSLYLRAVERGDAAMSSFAENSSFHPSLTLSGATAPVCAGALYVLVRVFGAEQNILVVFFVWFIVLSRFFMLAICVSDLLGLPECMENVKRKRVLIFAAFFVSTLLLKGSAAVGVISEAGVLYGAVLPFAAFALVRAKKRWRSEV